MANSGCKPVLVRGLSLTIFLVLLLTAAPRRLWTSASGQTQAPDLADGSLISDNLFLFASSVLDFDVQSFLETQPGPLAGCIEYIDGTPWTAAESIRYNAMYFGLNPQLILTLLEAQTQLLTGTSANVPLAASEPEAPAATATFHNYVRQLAERALLAYDNHRYGVSDSQLVFPDGETQSLPETLNAGTYAVQATLASSMSSRQWEFWIQGPKPLFIAQFSNWFGDPLETAGRLSFTTTLAPDGYMLPFPIGETWYYTGGPHYYGGGAPGCLSGPGCPRPWSSLDIAQPELIACPEGNYPALRWIVAAKSGIIIESSQALIVIDHGDGWRTYYSHIASADRRGPGPVNRGDRLGHPSCEVEPGGFTTGVHVHFALYQVGVGFVEMDGKSLSAWLVGEASHYNGTMRLDGVTREASTGRHAGTNDILNGGIDGSCPVAGGVLLYKNANYDCDGGAAGIGYLLRSTSGFQDLPGSFDNQASSIRIPSGWSARLYEYPGRAGASICLNGDDSNFDGDYFGGGAVPLNDRVSSFEVFEERDCPGPFIGGKWSVTTFGDVDLKTPCAPVSTFDGTYVFRDWGTESPAATCPADNWSVRLTRHAYFNSGNYTFGLTADDWARLKVDGQTVLDNWQGAGELNSTRAFSAGSYEVTIEYADVLGDSFLSAWWWGSGYDLPRESQEPDHWYARYWGNRALQGEPIVSLNEDPRSLYHRWESGSPGFSLPADRFSSRFERQVYFLCGTYRFRLSTDDGARFWIDDQLLLDAWFDQSSDYDVRVDLASDNHRLKVEYYENSGVATLNLDWTRESFCPHIHSTNLPLIRDGGASR